jgi:hypothetical protein
MDSEDPGQVSPVADPGLADQAWRRLDRQAGNPADGAAAATGCGGLVVSTAGLTVAVVLHFVAGLSYCGLRRAGSFCAVADLLVFRSRLAGGP